MNAVRPRIASHDVAPRDGLQMEGVCVGPTGRRLGFHNPSWSVRRRSAA